MERDYVTPNEAARLLNLATTDVVYRLLRSGRLSGDRVNGRWRIPREAVELRRSRVEHKRGSPSFRDRKRERRSAARERFAPLDP
jgi:excisionase family DNA binding protein